MHAAIRKLELKVARPIGILQDLQGPKIRVGTIKDGKITAIAGEQVRFVLSGSDGDRMSIPLPHPEIFDAVTPGDDLLIDDGRVRIRVTGLGADFIDARSLLRHHIEPQGRECPQRRFKFVPADCERPSRSCIRLGTRRRLGCPDLSNRSPETLSRPAGLLRTAPASWRRLKNPPPWSTSMTSSDFPMRSWSLAVTSAWKFRMKMFPDVRRQL